MSSEDAKSPRAVHVTQAVDVQVDPSHGQTDGMIRRSAIVGLSPSLCGTIMRALPHSSSAVHHHGEQDTIIYALSGQGCIVSSSPGCKGDVRQVLKPGDWALVPAWREHREVNDGEEEVVWMVVRAPGGMPVVVNLDGWGGAEV